MMYRFNFHDIRDGGFIITRHYEHVCDADAMMNARQRLCNRSWCDRVDIYRMENADTCGPMSHIASYTK